MSGAEAHENSRDHTVEYTEAKNMGYAMDKWPWLWAMNIQC